jgi:hypothetical protein
MTRIGRIEIGRIEIGLALGAAGLALATCSYFIFALLGEHEVCYGIQSDKLICEPISLQAATRLTLVVATILAFFGIAAAGAWFHHHAKQAGARSAGLGTLCTATVFIICMTAPALNGVGFFLVPATVLILAATGVGLYPAALDTWREIASEVSATSSAQRTTSSAPSGEDAK